MKNKNDEEKIPYFEAKMAERLASSSSCAKIRFSKSWNIVAMLKKNNKDKLMLNILW